MVAMMILPFNYKRHWGYFVLCCLLFFIPLHSEARVAKFADLLITNNAEQILVYARVTDCFTNSMEAAILAGVPTTFTFLFDFYQERPFWWDKIIFRCDIQHTIKYDNVKKIFQVSSTNSKESATFQTFDAAKRAMADLSGIVVAPVKTMVRDKSYYVKMKAKLDHVRLPLHMEYLFFFVSLWDFETDWYRQKVVY
jgi:hypothetical protein